MQRVNSVAELRALLQGRMQTAFVPTMGNLHAGHLSLIAVAKQHGQPVVASIFVNPLQFGPGEDYAQYPRTLEDDCAQLAAAGCDIVFAPAASELFAVARTFVVQPPPALADTLCGAFRPGHFSGVATVVLKLFNLVQPHVAVFGRKDFQQLRVIDELVRQFNLPIQVIGAATVRNADGLALSSRNGYLSAVELRQAARLHQELRAIGAGLAQGRRDFAALCGVAIRHLKMAGWNVDYVDVRDADTLGLPDVGTSHLVVLGAAWLGKTRLIDNIEYTASTAPG